MATYYPISNSVLQYSDVNGEPYVGAVLKAYNALTSTPLPMALDNNGTSFANTAILNASGYPTVSGNVIIPHFRNNYKISLYQDQAAADSDTGAIWTTPTIEIEDTSTSDALVDELDGDGSTSVFTLSQDVGTNEKEVMVFADRPLKDYVTNGTFDGTTGWSFPASWANTGNKAVASVATNDELPQTLGTLIYKGEAYIAKYTATVTSGSILINVGGKAGTSRSSSGTYTETIIADTTQILKFVPTSFVGDLDDVSLTRVELSRRELRDTTEYTVDGTTLTFLNDIPPAGIKNIVVQAPSLLLGQANGYALSAASSEANALASANAAASSASDASDSADAAAISESNAASSASDASDSADAAALSAQQVEDAKLIWQGTYNAGTAYEINDAVTYNGSSFICIQAGTGQTPTVGGTAYWDDLANKGDAGTFQDGDYGDFTVSGGVATIDDNVITNDMILDPELKAIGGLTSSASKIPYFTGSGTASMLDFKDEDDMASDSATAIPSQQSVKAYVDANAGGSGITITPQTLQATTTPLLSMSYNKHFNVGDGKVLRVRGVSGGTLLHLEILDIDTDGTITVGSDTTISGTNIVPNARYYNTFTLLQSNKVLMVYEENSTVKVALLTLDLVNDTVTISDTETLLASTSYNTYFTQTKKVNDTSAVFVYNYDATPVTYGKVITLATDTTLSISSQQTIYSNASYNYFRPQGLVRDLSSGDFITIGYCDDVSDIVAYIFTVSGTTITFKGLTNTNIFSALQQVSNLFAFDSYNGFIYGFTNSSATAIASSTSYPAFNSADTNIFYSTYNSGAGSPVAGLCGIDNVLARSCDNGAYNYLSIKGESNLFNYVLSSNNPTAYGGKVTLINKTTGEVKFIYVDLNGYNNTFGRTFFDLVKVRNGQYLGVFANASTVYAIYQPYLIEGVD